MTTSNSTSVKPRRDESGMHIGCPLNSSGTCRTKRTLTAHRLVTRANVHYSSMPRYSLGTARNTSSTVVTATDAFVLSYKVWPNPRKQRLYPPTNSSSACTELDGQSAIAALSRRRAPSGSSRATTERMQSERRAGRRPKPGSERASKRGRAGCCVAGEIFLALCSDAGYPAVSSHD
jgi:hypothetical protein